MIDPKELYFWDPDWVHVPRGAAPLIHLFTGFVDAGRLTNTVTETLLSLDHELVLEFNADELHDFRSRRPIMTFEDYSWTQASEITVGLYRCSDEEGQDFYLLTGPEPDMRWESMATAVLELAEQLGVDQLVTASAIPMAVPHTRPIIITAHGTDPKYTTGNKYVFDQSFKMPGSFSAFLEFAAGASGMPAFGYAAHIPHYFGQSGYPPAAVEVLSRIATETGLHLPLVQLMKDSAEHLERVNQETQGDAEIAAMIGELEANYDEMTKHAVPSLDEIGQAVESFLAEQNRKGD